jgi:FMN-dependent oxidoreductase (nitrilotriacetate monooxygenase family)
MSRQIHLNAFLMPNGHHEAAWRHPATDPVGATTFAHYAQIAKIAEAGKLDSLFLADGVALWGNVRHNSHNYFEPLTLLSALATVTDRIGLIATASTTYNEPYHLARKFASLDHLSGGRAGWNIVTSAGKDEARNFNREARPDHELRYERATEFLEVVAKLWDSWEDDTLVIDKDSGIYADSDKIHPAEHIGEFFRVHGALNIPRPVQGYPLLVQAGSSEAGKEYAARFAEAVFTAQQTFDEGLAFYRDVKSRLSRYGRTPEQIKILPGISPIIGATEAEAREREAEINALINPAYGLQQLSYLLDFDLSGYDLDAPLPDVGRSTEGNQSRFDLVVGLARRENLSLRQLIERLAGGRGHRVFAGTASQVADELEHWFSEGAADGFNIMPATLPGGLADFVEQVVPELQRRGLFRTEYSGTTLREHYGLPRPLNQFTTKHTADARAETEHKKTELNETAA